MISPGKVPGIPLPRRLPTPSPHHHHQGEGGTFTEPVVFTAPNPLCFRSAWMFFIHLGPPNTGLSGIHRLITGTMLPISCFAAEDLLATLAVSSYTELPLCSGDSAHCLGGEL